MKEISATEFKARCLALLDEVAHSGQILTIMKRGKPVAELHPPIRRAKTYPQLALKGSVRIVQDILAPVVTERDLDLEHGKL
jgi:antitoxin (DNA-binding transcriptional repressor) of toxin-antitoxin stability system